MDFTSLRRSRLKRFRILRRLLIEYWQSEIDEEHLLYQPSDDGGQSYCQVIGKMEVNDQGFIYQAEKLVAKRVKVSGQVQVYLSGALNQALMQAETEAKQMDDEYISL